MDSEDDKILKQVKIFTISFVNAFEDILSDCFKFLEAKNEKVDNILSKAAKAAITALGTYSVILKSVLDIFGDPLLKYLLEQKKTKKLNGLAKLIYDFKEEEKIFNYRQILVESCTDIFQSFEMQFMSVEDSEDLKKIAKFLAQKVFDYYANENIMENFTVDLIIQSVIAESSAKYEEEFEIGPPLNMSETIGKLLIRELFTKVGLVKEKENKYQYFSKESSDTVFYGHRRLFLSLDEKNSALDEDSDNCINYNYKFNRNKVKRYNRIILNNIINKNNFIYELRNPTKSFTGREKYLNKICEYINEEKQCVVITGLLGVGKSELVLKFAETYKQEFSNIVFINAEETENIMDIFCKLACELQISLYYTNTKRSNDSIINSVYSVLSKNYCLLIFDNAYCRKDIDRYLPHTKNIYVIITSQNQIWEDMLTINLDIFEQSEATEFIQKEIINEQTKDIEKLAYNLQFLPLALQQAVSYIKDQTTIHMKFTIANYLECFKQNEQLLNTRYPQQSDHPFPNFSSNNYNKTMFDIVKLALSKFETNETFGKNSVDFLNTIAYFRPDYISKNILKSFLCEIELRNIIAVLSKYSLITEHPDYICIHKLVLHILRAQQKEKNTEKFFLNNAMEIITSKDISLENEHGALVLQYAETYNCLIKFYRINDTLVKHKIFLMLCFNGYIKSIQNILRREPKMKNRLLNITDTLKRTAFHLSCMQGHEKVTSVLIDKGVDMNCKDRLGYLPVHYACIYGHLDILKLLKNHHEDLLKTISDTSALYKAAAENNIETVKSLHSSRCDLNLKHSGNMTALHVAASRGHIDIVEYLVQNNADKSAENYIRFTPLHGAIFTNSAAVKYLIQDADKIYMQNYAWSLVHLVYEFDQKDNYDLLFEKIRSFTVNKTEEEVQKFLSENEKSILIEPDNDAANVPAITGTKRKNSYQLRSTPAKSMY